MSFPPIPLYPNAYDSDYTLYKVHNTTESKLSADNQAWSSEIDITPASTWEVWPNSGFATLEGEIIYYDSVAKNGGGFVNKLKRCARNLGGNHTQFNRAGTWIRGFVMAEHHNQLVDAIINTQTFLQAIDIQLTELEAQPYCPDDSNCPQVEMHIDPASPNACLGTSTNYSVAVAGTYTNAQVDFGDGSTTKSLAGSHVYGQNAAIDPVATVQNNQCTVVVTGISRTDINTWTPSTIAPSSPYIETCSIPDIPQFIVPTFAAPTGFTMPQIPGPCIDLTPFGLSIPKIVISIPSIRFPNISLIVPSIPSTITIEGCNIPSTISLTNDLPSTISLIGPDPPLPSIISIVGPDLPSIISIVGPDIPSVISLVGELPSMISIVGHVPSVISLVGELPSIISVVDDIPSIISLVGKLPSIISVVDDIPSIISLVGPNPALPSIISIVGLELPSIISVQGISDIHVIGLSDITCSVIGLSNVYMSVLGLSDIHCSVIGLSNVVMSVLGLSNVYMSVIGLSNVTMSVIGLSNTFMSVIGLSNVQCSVNWGNVPSINVNWGSCSCAITVSCASTASHAFAAAPPDFNFQDGFALNAALEPNEIGIPSEITVVFPEDIPDFKVRLPEVMPEIIMKLEKPLPTEIKFTGVPESIKLDATDLPTSIRLDTHTLPEAIYLIPQDIPTVISVDGSDLPRTIKVEGIPAVIELKGPESIPLTVPENLEIPLVYKGGPIPVRFDISHFTGAASDAPRFVILPAPCPQA